MSSKKSILSRWIAALILTCTALPLAHASESNYGQKQQALGESCGVSLRFVGTAAGCSNTPSAVDLMVDYWFDTQPYQDYRVFIDVTNGANYSTSIDAFTVHGGTRGGIYRENDYAMINDNSWGRGVYKAFITVRDAHTGGMICLGQSQVNY